MMAKPTSGTINANEGQSAVEQRGIDPASPLFVSIWQKEDEDWRLVDYNEALLATTGGRLTSFSGAMASEFYQDRPDILEDMHRCTAGKSAIKRKMPYTLRSTGEDRFLTLSYIPVPPDLFLLVAEDITDEVQAELALQAARQAAEAAQHEEAARRHEAERRRLIAESLRAILAALNSDQPLEAVLDLIASRARRLLGTQAVGIYRLERGADTWSVEASRGLLVTYVAGSRVPVGQDTLRQAILTRKPVTSFAGGDGAIGRSVQSGQAINRSSSAVDDGERHRDKRLRRPDRRSWIGWYQAWLAVPIITKDEVFGGILLYYAEPRTLSEEEIQLAIAFGDQAALAIGNAQLRARVGEAAAEAERERLARELHDAITQTLFSASVIAEAVPRIWKARPEEAQEGMEELRRLTRGALAEMRTMLVELRPSALTEKPLGELLGHLCEAITSHSRIPVTPEVEGDTILPPDVQVALYRMAQEALNNVHKHARASKVWVTLWNRPGVTRLEVRDDGRGFDPVAAAHIGLGLGTMRERAESIGAMLAIDSQLGQGTRVTVEWEGVPGR
jgi:signal transduction histidine kinase